MKLFTWVKQLGICYRKAWCMWKADMLDAYQLPTETMIIYQYVLSEGTV